ncbi:MAG: hypothetical protein LBU14_06315 [Candidatus Peribacteria bacterium]|nr:hypothetical protein [Candidatus Peribacteria bacterium]
MNYKALYSENSSVINSNDYYSWSKIFVFPKDTKNSYFNFYDVIDDYSLR